MIAQLLYSFPLDHKTESGQYFWSGPKRPPQVIEYNPKDPVCLGFVVAATNIFAYSFGLDYCHDQERIKELSVKVPVPKFEVKKIKIKDENDQNNNQPEEKTEDDEAIIEKLANKLKGSYLII